MLRRSSPLEDGQELSSLFAREAIPSLEILHQIQVPNATLKEAERSWDSSDPSDPSASTSELFRKNGKNLGQ